MSTPKPSYPAAFRQQMVELVHPLELQAICMTTMPAGVKFWRGPVTRLSDRWPAAIGRRRHSPAQTELQQPVCC